MSEISKYSDQYGRLTGKCLKDFMWRTEIRIWYSVAVSEGCLPDFFTVKLDRPFIYAIMHDDTGLPVFAGAVNKL